MKLDIISYRVLISHLQIVFLVVCLFLSLLIHSHFTKTKINVAILIYVINYIIYYNLPSMVNLIIGNVSFSFDMLNKYLKISFLCIKITII